ncbi:MAG: glycosyltransferase family 2 protein [Deltaproteobacteria bacterium]|nr:glycosyltransferase family 2 protein [Deltaproteobacteria bacterium]
MACSTDVPIDISIIVPVYNEDQLLHALAERITMILRSSDLNFEILFIDDGSNDRSLEILAQLAIANSNVRVIALSRNFGQQAAFSAGIDQMRGRAAILMDADLQDDPAVIPNFVKHWKEGFDVVFAIRVHRKERTSKRWAYTIFYKILSFLADSPIPRDAGDFCLLDEKVVKQLRAMPEYHRFLRGMRGWLGFKQLGIPVPRDSRFAGSPKYNLRKLTRLALDGIMTSSTLPLRAISVLGLILAVIATIMALVYLYIKISSGLGPPGFATLVVIVCFFSGIQLIVIGVVGEYVGRIFEQVRGRPTYVIREILSPPSQNNAKQQ